MGAAGISNAADGVLTAPIVNSFAITPHDTNNETEVSRGLYVGVSGDVVIVHPSGDAITYRSMAAGIWHPVVFIRINSTGTTATNMVGGY